MKNKKDIHTQKATDSVYKKSSIGNGLKIITEQVHSTGTFALGFQFKAGSRDDFPGKEGTAHFMEHSAFRRSKKMSARKIATQFESLGAYVNAYTTQELTSFYVRALDENFNRIFPLVAEIAFNPEFSMKDTDKEREIILEEISSYEDDPEDYILDIADMITFSGSPLGNPIVGFKKSVQEISINDLENFHNKFYTPSNSVISYVGPKPHELITAKAEKLLGNLNNKPDKYERTSPVASNPIRKIITRDITQSHFIMTKQIPGHSKIDRYSLAVFNILFGDGMSSRLYHSLRERKAFAYSIYSNYQLFSDSGSFYIYAATDAGKILRLENGINSELSGLLAKPINTKELTRAKEQLKTSYFLELESLSSRMQGLARQEFLSGEYEDPDTTLKLINSISCEDITKFVAEHILDGNWSVGILKPGK